MILLIIFPFNNFFCEFCDDCFHITNYFKDKERKKGTENKLSWILQ